MSSQQKSLIPTWEPADKKRYTGDLEIVFEIDYNQEDGEDITQHDIIQALARRVDSLTNNCGLVEALGPPQFVRDNYEQDT